MPDNESTTWGRVLADVNRRSALTAQAYDKFEIATTEDQIDSLQSFYDAVVPKLRIAAGMMHEEQLDDDQVEDDPDDSANEPELPVELELAAVFYVLAQWYLSIAEAPLFQQYDALYEKEVARHRFTPGVPTKGIQIKYRPLG